MKIYVLAIIFLKKMKFFQQNKQNYQFVPFCLFVYQKSLMPSCRLILVLA